MPHFFQKYCSDFSAALAETNWECAKRLWEDLEDAETGDIFFYGITLKVPLGEFPAGTEFPSAFWMGSQGALSVTDKQDQEHIFTLNISVGEKIDTENFYEYLEGEPPSDINVN